MSGREENAWQRRYDRSIVDEKQRIAELEANESVWSKVFATLTETPLDLVIFPVALIIFGTAALRRRRTAR